MQKKHLLYAVLTILLLVGFSQGLPASTHDSSGRTTSYSLVEAFPNLSFSRPVDFQSPNDGTSRIFVVEQEGRIKVFAPNTSTSAVFLDLTELVEYGGERGLLGLAFHPDYANNGYLFLDYTKKGSGETVIARYQVDGGDPSKADPDSAEVLLTVDQPYSNHNAGQIAFGPDGYLYISLGDGGSGGDPDGNGQDLTTLLGSILRVDVDNNEGNMKYAIPESNPFYENTNGYKEEIFAYGLRNPWRMSFDPVTGWLWAADVGQNTYEEVNIIKKGGNYGWDVMEGFHCYEPSEGCDETGLELPIVEYDHSQGNSITGGYVYRGSTVPSLVGSYLYADFGTGKIWALEYDGENQTNNTLLLDTDYKIVSFGTDRNEELFILDYGGSIYKFANEKNQEGELPIIFSPGNQTYSIETVGTLMWTVVDTDPSTYILYKNSSEVGSGDWTSASPVMFSLAGLDLGTYNFTLVVTDLAGNIGTDEVWVVVSEEELTIPTGQRSSTSATAPGFEFATLVAVLGLVKGFSRLKRRTKDQL